MQSVAVFFCLLVMCLIRGCESDSKASDRRYPNTAGDVEGLGQNSKCLTERREETARRQNPEVHIPECGPDGAYNEIQCHAKTGYCWCVTRDGRHIPGTSVKNMRPKCKSKRKKRKGRGGDIKSRKRIVYMNPRGICTAEYCSSKERQTFNSVLIKLFKEEYDRVNVTPTTASAAVEQAEEFGSEKVIVMWKFGELDANKDEELRFKEIRKFGKMVKKLIKPKTCARQFLEFCDKNTDQVIEKAEWTLCLGVDIKQLAFKFKYINEVQTAGSPDSATTMSPVDEIRQELLRWPSSSILKAPDAPLVSNGPSSTNMASKPDKQDPKETSQNCLEEREAAVNIHAQEPAARHYVPVCTSGGLWEQTQCHQSTGYCWCVKKDTGNPIPGTATYKVKPNCSFENEREMKGCPFDDKQRFLVDLLSDLAEERKKALLESNNQTNSGPDGNLSLRETVARWKLKMLDTNSNEILERKEWRPFRRTTLKNKNYSRKCRRSFLRYCDADGNKKITYDEWKDCLGLNQNNFNSLPLNPKRREKNPFNLINYLRGD